MTSQEASWLYAYNDWANARLFTCARELTGESWAQDMGGAFPTLLSLLGHVVGSEWIWLKRWQEASPTERPDWMGGPTPEGLWAILVKVERERAAFLETLTPEALERPIRYTLLDGSRGRLPLATLLQHTANHSTYHRGQIAAVLRRLGAAPPATDLLVFAWEEEERRDAAHSRPA